MLPLFIELDDLTRKVESHNLQVPDGKVEANEQVVGVLDDPELQRLYSVGAHMLRDAMIAGVHRAMASGDAKREFTCKAVELKEKGDMAMKAFWVSLRDKYDLWGHEDDGIGIRAGWKVVTMDLSEQRAAASELAHLLAAGVIGQA